VNENNQVYQWTRRDKVLHLLPAIPLVVFYVGTAYLLAYLLPTSPQWQGNVVNWFPTQTRLEDMSID
jgi:hypothetical protein